MSEPVAWMVKSKIGLIRACWSARPSEGQIVIAKFDGDTITPLHTGDEIGRKDAAIAELLMVLHEIEGGGGVQGEVATNALAKYDIPTKVAA